MDELKPCPFCGGKAYVLEGEYAREYAPIWFVHCGTYDCIAYIGGKPYDSEEKAIAAWNRRADDADTTDALNRAAGNWAKADAENRELRELVICMYQTINGMKRKAANGDWLLCTDSCPHWASGDCVDLPDEECFYTAKIDELGIEA